MKVYDVLNPEYEKKWKDEYYFHYQRYAPISKEEIRWLKKKVILKTIGSMRNENQASNKDTLTKESIEVILVE